MKELFLAIAGEEKSRPPSKKQQWRRVNESAREVKGEGEGGGKVEDKNDEEHRT